MTLLKIAGGHVVDPANGVDGVGDLWIEGGRIVAAPDDPGDRSPTGRSTPGATWSCPAGVDVHCHIAGPKVNAARMMRPEEASAGGHLDRSVIGRSGTLGSVPSTFTTGYEYAGLGYATAVDAAIAPLMARQTHHELDDTPIIDKAFLVLHGQ